MVYPNVSLLPLGSVIAAVLALDEALARPQFPQARHHARIVAVRANRVGFPDVGRRADALLAALSQAIRPDRHLWAPAPEHLHRCVDEALDVAPLRGA